jgi:hypothetical protein
MCAPLRFGEIVLWLVTTILLPRRPAEA